MTNLSDLTRRDQVLLKLKSAHGEWVDGPELANEHTGGSEGLKRLRELREDFGYDIRKRKHPDPDRSIFQYRLVPRDAALYTVDPSIEVTEGPRSEFDPQQSTISEQMHDVRVEPAETYEYKQPPKPRTGGGHLGKTEDGKYIYVRDEPPVAEGQIEAFDQVTEIGEKFTAMPGSLELGRTVPCPRCGGYRRAIRERDPVTNKQMKTGKVIGYEERSRDPHRPSNDCPRCNGFGVVPK